MSDFDIPHSSVAGAIWPAVAIGPSARLLAVLQQLAETQWWPPDEIARQQYRQLRAVVAHAYRTVPFYRARLDALGYMPGQEIGPDFWRRVPLLGRRDLAQSFAALGSTQVPESHGRRHESSSSGSTGTPVRIVKTELEQLFWAALTLREELWQDRDRSQTLAVIRQGQHSAPLPDGTRQSDWGLPVATVYPTGPMAVLEIAAPTAEQARWLARVAPGYFLTVPSNLRALARHCRDNGLLLPSLRGVRTVGEVVDADLRQDCRDAWSVEIADMYSAVEVGYIALQCPGREHYHIQSESVLVELLDDAGAPCRPGERGRVVLTPLHNFAMPLLRYDIGDFAVMGEPCACGRGLPVLAQMVGRVRDMLVLPSGVTRYPTGLYGPLRQIAGVVQYQLVQKSLDALEFRLVVRPPYEAADGEPQLRAAVAKNLGAEFAVSFTYVDDIPRSPSGKFFEFLSEIASEPTPAPPQ